MGKPPHPPHWDRRAIELNHIRITVYVKQRSCADVNSPYKRKCCCCCCTNSVVLLVNSLLWAFIRELSHLGDSIRGIENRSGIHVYTVQYRDGIHESTILLTFLCIILRFLPSFLPFYKMLFMNKLEFTSLIDCFVWISVTIGVVWFSVRFWMSNATFKGKQRDSVNKAKPPATFRCYCMEQKS